MYGLKPALDCAPKVDVAVAARKLRRWSAPSLILAITDFADEEKLLFNVIRQAMPGRAKVLLANVLASRSASPRGPSKPPAEENSGLAKTARAALEQMARQLRWVGIDCEPILLRGEPSEEIQQIVDARGVDRIILTQQFQGAADSTENCLAEELLRAFAAPICKLGPCMPLSPQSEAPAGSVTLALSPGGDFSFPLAFASRLAQEQRAKLTVLHVFDPVDRQADRAGWTPAAVASLILEPAIKEAGLCCPVEILVREGDAAAETLRYVNSVKQDFLILGPLHAGPSDCAAVLCKVACGARCPVMFLGGSIAAVAGGGSRGMEQLQRQQG